MSKSKPYRCTCGEEFNKEKELIEHCRKEHPEEPEILMTIFGYLGDPYADKIIIGLRNDVKKLLSEGQTVSKKDQEIEMMREYIKNLESNYNTLVDTLNNIKSSIDSAAKAVNPKDGETDAG